MLFPAGFSRNVDQRPLIAAHGEMAVDRVVAEIGEAADKPFREWRPAVVEHRLERLVPVHELRLLGPELLAAFDGLLVKLFVSRHPCFLQKRDW